MLKCTQYTDITPAILYLWLDDSERQLIIAEYGFQIFGLGRSDILGRTFLKYYGHVVCINMNMSGGWIFYVGFDMGC